MDNKPVILKGGQPGLPRAHLEIFSFCCLLWCRNGPPSKQNLLLPCSCMLLTISVALTFESSPLSLVLSGIILAANKYSSLSPILEKQHLIPKFLKL